MMIKPTNFCFPSGCFSATKYSMHRSFLFAFLAVLSTSIFLSACASTQGYAPLPEANEADVLAGYKLGPSDDIRVTVFGEDDLSGTFGLDGNGRISLPLAGDVLLKDMTVSRAEQEIAQVLRGDYLKSPRVSVEVLKYRPFYILGEVKRPGSYPYVAGMNLSNAVALGGGFTYRADKSTILVTRGDSEPYLAPETSATILPGDVIEVKERFF